MLHLEAVGRRALLILGSEIRDDVTPANRPEEDTILDEGKGKKGYDGQQCQRSLRGSGDVAIWGIAQTKAVARGSTLRRRETA